MAILYLQFQGSTYSSMSVVSTYSTNADIEGGSSTYSSRTVVSTYSSNADIEGGSSMNCVSGGGSFRMMGSYTGTFLVLAWSVKW